MHMVDIVSVINDPNVSISHKCLVRINAVYKSLKSAEMKAVDFLLSHPEEFAGSSIVEVAAKAGCSEATLVRLARKLGFSGYPDLKGSVMRTKNDSDVLYQEISPEDGEIEVIRKVFQTSIQAISDTLNIIDIAQYEKAVLAMEKANKILFIGAGDAATVAMTGYHKFSRMGIDAEFSQDYDIQLVLASHLKKNDVLIAISHSGQTKTVIDVVRIAKNEGATVIGITNFPMSTLARSSTILLTISAFVQNAIGEIMTKRIPALCIIESLYVSIIRKMDAKSALTLEKSNDALTINKM
jgi:RpiR family carbohydrate utilization transcriptional regulator